METMAVRMAIGAANYPQHHAAASANKAEILTHANPPIKASARRTESYKHVMPRKHMQHG